MLKPKLGSDRKQSGSSPWTRKSALSIVNNSFSSEAKKNVRFKDRVANDNNSDSESLGGSNPMLIEEQDLEVKNYKRTTLPPTKGARVDKRQLRIAIAKGGIELENHITEGHMPIFGYPMVCYSPIGDDAEQKDQFKQAIFNSVMKNRGDGTEMHQVKEEYDTFNLLH